MKKLAVIAGTCLVAAGATYAAYERSISLENRIRLQVTANSTVCDQDFPVGINIRNSSREQVNPLVLLYKVQRAGYSNTLESSAVSTDRIIPPGESYFVCLERPKTFPSQQSSTYDKYPESELV